MSESQGQEAASKAARRRELRRFRDAIANEERDRIDDAITLHCLALPEWEQATHVFSYLSFGSEVDTRALIRAAWAQSKIVVLPRCVPGSRDMSWHRVDDFDHLTPSALGIQEPDPAACEEVDPALIASSIALVPGLSFDMLGHRLGYGGGYYDRFLAGYKGWTAGLCREAALCEVLASVEPHDRPVAIVVTERRVVRSS